MYPPPQQHLYAQQLIPGWEQRTHRGQVTAGAGGSGSGGGDGPFSDAFDFSFDRYATPAVVKVVYVLTMIVAVLGYVGTVLLMFAAFLPSRDIGGILTYPGTPLPGILALVLGWIPGFLTVLMIRVALELALATTRTATDVRAIRTRYVGPVYE